jgi:hypothetical protein
MSLSLPELNASVGPSSTSNGLKQTEHRPPSGVPYCTLVTMRVRLRVEYFFGIDTSCHIPQSPVISRRLRIWNGTTTRVNLALHSLALALFLCHTWRMFEQEETNQRRIIALAIIAVIIAAVLVWKFLLH